jgi:hypothetical protein
MHWTTSSNNFVHAVGQQTGIVLFHQMIFRASVDASMQVVSCIQACTCKLVLREDRTNLNRALALAVYFLCGLRGVRPAQHRRKLRSHAAVGRRSICGRWAWRRIPSPRCTSILALVREQETHKRSRNANWLLEFDSYFNTAISWSGHLGKYDPWTYTMIY